MQATIDKPAIEYLDGRPCRKMSPKASHAFVQGAFVRLLYRLGSGLGKCLPELHCRVGAVDSSESVLVPDVSFLTNERWNALSPQDRQEPPCAPDVVVEIRSPHENAELRRRKVARYLNTGAALVLDVDPAARSIDVHDATGVRTLHSDDAFSDARFPWLAFDVAEVFADLDD
ncbi:MAG: Uma2 family endonuclease [Candidatus Tyrphobacter sp.]